MASFRRKHFHKRRDPSTEDADEPQPTASPPEPEDEAPPQLVAAAPVAVPKTKKQRYKQKKAAAAALSQQAEKSKSVAAALLKKNLRQRLHTRLKMKSTARAGGTSQDVQNILEKFNDGDDQKADMMREIQNDVRGMRHKDAKKYLQKVMGTMSPDDTSTFVDMVKDKVPANQSSSIVNYVKRHRKIHETDDKKKLQVNPDTVYVPTRLMSEEAKAAAQAAAAATESGPKKKKKAFGRINIQVPKLAELRDHPGMPEAPSAPPPSVRSVPSKGPVGTNKNKKKKKGFTPTLPRVVEAADAPAVTAPPPVPGVPRPRATGDRAKDIEKLFPDLSRHSREEQEAARLSYFQRLKNVTAFDPAKLGEGMRQFMFEASDVVEILVVRDVEFLAVPEAMEVPETIQLISEEALPVKLRTALPPGERRVVLDETKQWIYKRASLSPEATELVLVKAQNAYPECEQFLQRFGKVKAWLDGIRGQKVPWQWLCEVLNDLGILRQKPEQVRAQDTSDKTWPEYFRLLCHEYRSETKKLSVPIVPFVKLTLGC